MLRKIAALYCLVVGVSIAAVWCVYFATGSVFGVKPAGGGIGFHIAAEFAAAALMAIAGIGLFASARWAKSIYFLAMGMLMYALINSPGYYLSSSGGILMMIVFGVSFVFSIIFVGLGFTLEDK